MKLVYPAAALLFLMAQLSIPVHAGSKEGWDPQKNEETMEKRSEKKLEKMTKELKLSKEQEAAIKAAFDSRNEKLAALHKDFGDKKKAVMEETDQQIAATLNDQQKAAYEKMKSDMKDKHGKSPHQRKRLDKK